MCASISTTLGGCFCGKHASPRKIHHPTSGWPEKFLPNGRVRLTLHSLLHSKCRLLFLPRNLARDSGGDKKSSLRHASIVTRWVSRRLHSGDPDAKASKNKMFAAPEWRCAAVAPAELEKMRPNCKRFGQRRAREGELGVFFWVQIAFSIHPFALPRSCTHWWQRPKWFYFHLGALLVKGSSVQLFFVRGWQKSVAINPGILWGNGHFCLHFGVGAPLRHTIKL